MSTLKPALPRDESELGRNRAEKGDKSYYYAHNEGWEVPKDAIVRTGEGIITGGKPVPLGPDGKPVDSGVSNGGYAGENLDEVSNAVVANLRERVAALEKELKGHRAAAKKISSYSISDEGAKCKVYVEAGTELLQFQDHLPGDTTFSESAVSVRFLEKMAQLNVLTPGVDHGPPGGAPPAPTRYALSLYFDSEVLPEKCVYKVDRAKGRITLTCRKKDESRKWARIRSEA